MKPLGNNEKPNEVRKKRSRWDVAIAVFCVLGGAVGLYTGGQISVLEGLVLPSSGSGIGDVRRLEGGVRYRTHSSLVWIDLDSENRSVENGDRVFTGEDGSADLTITGAASARLMPNTLVVVRALPKADDGEFSLGNMLGLAKDTTKSVEIENGDLTLNLKDGGGDLEVTARGQTFRATGSADASLNVSVDASDPDAPVQIQSSKDVEIEISDSKTNTKKKLSLTAGQAADVGEARKELTVPELIAPDDKVSVYTPENTKSVVKFQWRKPAPRTRVEIELSKNDGTSQILAAAENAESLEAELDTGEYRWHARTRAKSVKAAPSAWTEWRGLNLPVDIYAQFGRLNASKKAEVLNGRDLKAPLVRLRWDAVPGINGYSVSVFGNDGKIITTQTVKGPLADIRLNPLKKALRFIVKARTPGGRTLASEETPLVPELPVPQTPSLVSGTNVSPTALTWTRAPLAQNYVAQIAKDADFKSLLLDKATPENSVGFKANAAGQYFWRVKSKSGNFESAWSPVSTVRISDTKIALKSPDDKAVLDDGRLDSTKGAILFTWTASSPRAGYTVEIAMDAQFRVARIERRVSRNAYAHRELPPGRYFWRVRSDDGRTSDVHEFTIDD